MLKPLKIAPEKVGPKDKRLSGYTRVQFDDAFERYLSAEEVTQPDTHTHPGKRGLQPDNRTPTDEMGTSEISQPDTLASGVRLRNARNPNNDGPVSGCPVGTEETGNARVWSAEKSDGLPYHAGKSDDFPYTGQVVEVPDQGPDPLDEHGEPRAAGNAPPSPSPLMPGRARELHAWSLDWAANQQAKELDVSTATLEAELRIILREEVAPDEVEAAIKQVMNLVFMS
jgi:hypothetical protein